MVSHHVPDGVGKDDAGDQGHEGADDDKVAVLPQPGPGQGQGGEGGEGGAHHGFQEKVGVQPGEGGHTKADDQAAHPGAQGVPRRAAEKEGEKGGAQEVGDRHDGEGKAAAGVPSFLKQPSGLGEGRDLGAQAAAQAVIQLQLVHIGAVGGGGAADLGLDRAVGGGKADKNAVGNDEGVGLRRAVGQQEPLDGLLHPVNFRPALQQAVAQVGGEEEKRVIVHCGHPHKPFRSKRRSIFSFSTNQCTAFSPGKQVVFFSYPMACRSRQSSW